VATVPGRGLIASASRDGTARLWIPETGEEIRKFVYTNRNEVSGWTALAVSPDGRTLALGGDLFTNTLTLWDVATGRQILAVDAMTNSIRSLAFSADGRIIAAVHS